MTIELTGRWLVGGSIDGPIVRLDEPLSFWGGFDATTGTIIDHAHPQCGAVLVGRVVVMPGSKGSSGTPGVLGDAIRRGTGPRALVIATPDVNLVAGCITAEALYGIACPILLVDQPAFDMLTNGTPIRATARETAEA